MIDTPDLLSWLVLALGAVSGVFAWIATRRSASEQNAVKALEIAYTVQATEIQSLRERFDRVESINRLQLDHIRTLEDWINAEKGPPPPDRPSALNHI